MRMSQIPGLIINCLEGGVLHYMLEGHVTTIILQKGYEIISLSSSFDINTHSCKSVCVCVCGLTRLD